jgi:hypothetical protein
MYVYHFKNFEMLNPDAGELLGGHPGGAVGGVFAARAGAVAT